MDDLQAPVRVLFVEQKSGQALMKKQGFMPIDALTLRHPTTKQLMQGYELPTDQLQPLLATLDKRSITYEQPNTSSFSTSYTTSLPERLAQWHPDALEARTIGHFIGTFLDISGTATARATFYNTAEEQRAAVEHQHERMFSLDRGLYCALMTLPGTTDFNRQLAIKKLLHQPRRPHHQALLSDAEELNILRWLVQTLPPTRMLKMFVMLKESRVNNARTRKLMLRSLLSHPRLELWCTRYRKKLRIVLEHALGQRMSGIVRSITKKAPSSWNDKEQNILHKHIGKHGHASQQKKVYECVSFILGNEEHLCLPLLKAYKAAKHDLEEGKRLPYETLEGIRSTYHKEIPTTQVLSLTKGQLTEGQKIGMQRAAEKAGVEVTFDPNKQSALRLYIYSFERGMDESIKQALQKKATQAAQNLPTRWKHAGLLVDASASMMGDSTQALRPMSVALATRDMLRAASETSSVLYCGGRHEEETGLTYPCGGTSLAEGLIQLLRDTPDVVFILSDGYENSPAGRLAEVIKQIRKLGINTPIYQFSPVFGAESGGLRCLAKDLIPALPVTSPQDMGLPLLKGMLQNEPVKALQGLLTLTTKLLSGQVHKQMTAKPPHTPLNAKVA